MVKRFQPKIEVEYKNSTQFKNYLTKNCFICNKLFTTINPLKKYCSITCKRINDYKLTKNGTRIKHQGNKINCLYCKKEIEQNSSGSKKFCSKHCRRRAIYFRLGRKYKDDLKFNGNRETALKRDNWKCTTCNISNETHLKKFNCYLHVHHIDFNKKNSSLDNLITLCDKCHKLIHNPTHLLKKKIKVQLKSLCPNSEGIVCKNKLCQNKKCVLHE
jgi:endogenous inhibitor of DNA gyrase (YacG/DUF329 family)